MAIITISRGTFAGGATLASMLGPRLNYRVVSRELLLDRVRDTFGIVQHDLEAMMDKTPAVFDPAAKATGRRVLTALQASLCELIGEDNAVYHGNVGHLFFPGVFHVLSVRLIAARSARIDLCRQREHLNEFEASRRIDQVDAERARWGRFFYGVDVSDPSLYDMVFNLEAASIEDAAECVAYTAKLPSFTATEVSRKRLTDLTLASRVRAKLLLEPSTHDLDVQVEADGGRVRLSGLVSQEHYEQVAAVVRDLPGVQKIETAQPVT
jgi:cytidylate kinase